MSAKSRPSMAGLLRLVDHYARHNNEASAPRARAALAAYATALTEHSTGGLEKILRHIATTLEKILMNSAEQTAALEAIGGGLTTLSGTLSTSGDQLVKGLGEVTDEIAKFQAAAGTTTPEQDALFASITDKLAAATTAATGIGTVAQSLDDLNPDAAGATPATLKAAAKKAKAKG